MKHQQGFTLIEAIVAASVFATTIASISGIYAYTQRLNRKTDVTRTAAETARYFTEYLSKEIRNGKIDYYPISAICSTPAITGNDYRLAIVNIDNDRLCFYVGDNAGAANSAGTNLWLVKNNYAPTRVNNPNVTITGLRMYIKPTTDPDVTTNPSRTWPITQPTVSLVGNIQVSVGTQNSASIPFQTSVSTLQYDLLGP